MDGDNIPWNEPEFSRRMLREHLSQAHNAASRRFELIDSQVEFIHREFLGKRPARVLDLGCGPGFYLTRLAQLGHEVTGVDYSPASVTYALEEARTAGLDIAVVDGDVRAADFGGPYDLVLLLSGELNVFRPEHASEILRRAAGALAPGGSVLVEASTYDAIRSKATGIRWYWRAAGLWSDGPHSVIEEAVWDDASQTAIARYYIVAADNAVRLYSATYQAYTDEDLRRLLQGAGLSEAGTVDGWAAVSGTVEFLAFVAYVPQ